MRCLMPGSRLQPVAWTSWSPLTSASRLTKYRVIVAAMVVLEALLVRYDLSPVEPLRPGTVTGNLPRQRVLRAAVCSGPAVTTASFQFLLTVRTGRPTYHLSAAPMVKVTAANCVPEFPFRTVCPACRFFPRSPNSAPFRCAPLVPAFTVRQSVM